MHATLTFIHSIMDLSDQISSSMAEMGNDSDDDDSNSSSATGGGGLDLENTSSRGLPSSSTAAAAKREARKRAAAVGALWNTVVTLLTDAEALPQHAAGLPQLWQQRAVLGPQRTHQRLMDAAVAYRAALHGLVERRTALAAAYSDLVNAVQTSPAPATSQAASTSQTASSSLQKALLEAPGVDSLGADAVVAAAVMAPRDDNAVVKNESNSASRTPAPPQRDKQHTTKSFQGTSAPSEPAPPLGPPPPGVSSSSTSQLGAADGVPKARKAREKGEKKTKERSEMRREKGSRSSKLLPPPPSAPPVPPPPPPESQPP